MNFKLKILLVKFCISLLFFKSLISIIVPSFLINLTVLFSIILAIAIQHKNYKFNIELKELGVVFLLLIINLIYHIIYPWVGFNLLFIIQSFIQLVFLFVLLSFFLFLTYQELQSISKYYLLLTLLVVVIGLIEIVFIPKDIILLISDFILKSKVGDEASNEGYIDVTFGFKYLRPGSIFFEPLTLSTVASCGLYLISFLPKKKSSNKVLFILSLIISIVSLVKSAQVNVFNFFISKFKKLFIAYTISIIIIIPFLIFYLLNSNIYLLFIEQISSIGNHILALYFGIKNSINANLLMGNGLGTAGFINAIVAKEKSLTYPFYRSEYFDPYIQNGNESFVGILFYQLGFLFGLYFILKLLYLIVKNVSVKSTFSAFLLYVLFFISLSESFVSQLISFSIIFTAVCLWRKKSY